MFGTVLYCESFTQGLDPKHHSRASCPALYSHVLYGTGSTSATVVLLYCTILLALERVLSETRLLWSLECQNIVIS